MLVYEMLVYESMNWFMYVVREACGCVYPSLLEFNWLERDAKAFDQSTKRTKEHEFKHKSVLSCVFSGSFSGLFKALASCSLATVDICN